ncbi:UNKNOWN [Stylonychia lemnae]|uniref:C2H2-type domain-containing protein n=1 Tax=Stylonychia lemnae TaxID=5949 RepID=A0A078AUI5_STYLE|nr:UNKNOWN [Stylonychia lemnae]|eukprot:CDW84538.1 UNKNOWN [Stylonychia lemnae]
MFFPCTQGGCDKLFNLSYVTKLSHSILLFKSMLEFTTRKNPINVISKSATKHFLKFLILSDISVYILEKSPILAIIVENNLHRAPTSNNTFRSTTSRYSLHEMITLQEVRSQFKCIFENCDKMYLYPSSLKKHYSISHKDQYEKYLLDQKNLWVSFEEGRDTVGRFQIKQYALEILDSGVASDLQIRKIEAQIDYAQTNRDPQIKSISQQIHESMMGLPVHKYQQLNKEINQKQQNQRVEDQEIQTLLAKRHQPQIHQFQNSNENKRFEESNFNPKKVRLNPEIQNQKNQAQLKEQDIALKQRNIAENQDNAQVLGQDQQLLKNHQEVYQKLLEYSLSIQNQNNQNSMQMQVIKKLVYNNSDPSIIKQKDLSPIQYSMPEQNLAILSERESPNQDQIVKSQILSNLSSFIASFKQQQQQPLQSAILQQYLKQSTDIKNDNSSNHSENRIRPSYFKYQAKRLNEAKAHNFTIQPQDFQEMTTRLVDKGKDESEKFSSKSHQDNQFQNDEALGKSFRDFSKSSYNNCFIDKYKLSRLAIEETIFKSNNQIEIEELNNTNVLQEKRQIQAAKLQLRSSNSGGAFRAVQKCDSSTDSKDNNQSLSGQDNQDLSTNTINQRESKMDFYVSNNYLSQLLSLKDHKDILLNQQNIFKLQNQQENESHQTLMQTQSMLCTKRINVDRNNE